MDWKDYSDLKNSHAFLGGSNYAWRNYDFEKLEKMIIASYANSIGTAIHEYAAKNIKAKFRMNKNDRHSVLRHLTVECKIPQKAVDIDFIFPNLVNYVNDCIGFGLDPEVRLYFSKMCFGTADAISFENNVLQISDLKTGKTQASFTQLENYAAMFCLNYNVKPNRIDKIIFRIYQFGEVLVAEPPTDILDPIIHQIVEFNKFLTTWF